MASLISFGRSLGLSGTNLQRALLGTAVGIAAQRRGRLVRNHSRLTPLAIPELWPLEAGCASSLRRAPGKRRAELLTRVAAHVPEDLEDPCAALGRLHESLLQSVPSRGSSGAGAHARKTTGAYFTPPDIVERLLDEALEPALSAAAHAGGAAAILRLRVCDPACGSGNFLLAAGRRIAARLAAARGLRNPHAAFARVARRCLFGVDIDPIATDLCRACFWLAGGPAPTLLHVRAADALTGNWPRLFPGIFPRGFDAVIGNPPFLNQLARPTATSRDSAAALRRRFPGAVGAYTDPAALFLLLAGQIARRGGRASLILPQSILTSRDAGRVRAELLDRGVLESLWIARERVFDANVLVCAPTIRIGGPPARAIRRAVGASFRRLTDIAIDHAALRAAPTWSALAADAAGIPDLPSASPATLADLADATADFRDQYYGLRGLVLEHDAIAHAADRRFPRLITTGLIDPARCLWGQRPTRFNGKAFRAPRVDLARLRASTDLGPWAAARLRPKVLLATQTRILEAAVDERGQWLPLVPLITIAPRDPARIWHIAAAILSPIATAWALRHYAGAGLSADAIKLSARQALALPVPVPSPDWDRAAALVRKAASAPTADTHGLLARAAASMCRASGLDAPAADRICRWWRARSGI